MDCIHHAGLHVNADHFYPEVLNPATNEACADGGKPESLSLQRYPKKLMPLLRYRTKDLTSIDHSRCACGRTTPRISQVHWKNRRYEGDPWSQCIPDPG